MPRGIPAIDYSHVNPGIRETVRFLRERGFKTCDSGDGKTGEFECDRDHAYVVVSVDGQRLIDEADRLKEVLEDRLGKEIEPIDEDYPNKPSIQATYDPGNRLGFIDLVAVDDKLLGLG